MGALPPERVQQSEVWQNIGLDHWGPTNVRLPNGEVKKVWVLLITCMATRNLVLDWVTSLSTESFLRSFRRFCARHRVPRTVWSDNAKGFKLASGVLSKIWDPADLNDPLSSYLAKEKIRWRFITERAAWMGGFWERLVKISKQALFGSIGRKTLNFDELTTYLAEATAICNSRPLVSVTEELNPNCVLRPVDFTNPFSRQGLPPAHLSGDDEDFRPLKEESPEKLISLWKHTLKMLEKY